MFEQDCCGIALLGHSRNLRDAERRSTCPGGREQGVRFLFENVSDSGILDPAKAPCFFVDQALLHGDNQQFRVDGSGEAGCEIQRPCRMIGSIYRCNDLHGAIRSNGWWPRGARRAGA